MSYRVAANRWRFAQRKELLYQRTKAASVVRDRAQLGLTRQALEKSSYVGELLATFGVESTDDQRILEVGSGAHGIIWRWPVGERVALDPLAVFYSEEFSYLQSGKGIRVVQAKGEAVPFPDACFDLVFSDNVLDHTENPKQVLCEIGRVLKPGGLLYFVVDTHHPFWKLVGGAFNALFRIGIKLNVRAFPHHPFHFTRKDIAALFAAASLDIGFQRSNRTDSGGGIVECTIKTAFYKNRRLELIATNRGSKTRGQSVPSLRPPAQSRA